MKKSLLFSAAALLLAGTMNAQTFTAETVWSYDVTADKVNPVPELDADWKYNKDTQTATATCSRFAVGLNGKMLTTDHKKNAIIAIDKDGVTTFKELPARTAEKWLGTAVTTDDAGNVIFNYNFTDKVGSAQEWGVITKDGTLYDLTCSSSLANQGGTGRVDIMGHVVGDVTSAEGGIGYVVTQSAGAVIKMTFTGDGTKPTGLNCVKAYDYPLAAVTAMGGNSQLTSACPRFTSVEAINAFEGPAFILPLGICGNAVENCPSIEEGWVGKFLPAWNPGAPAMGNRWYMGIAYFELGGKSYIVRNYISPEFEAAHPVYTKWKATLNFAVYEYDAATNTAKIAATWQESLYGNGNGNGTLTAEVVDDNTVNIYTWGATISDDEAAAGTKAGCYGAMVKLTKSGDAAAMEGDGTEANPYQLTKPAHLLAMKDLVSTEKTTYFKLMNDIDMDGVNYIPPVGWNNVAAEYPKNVEFDGNYHVISNLTSVSPEGEGKFYYASLIGILRGTVKNLGLVDVNLKSELGAAGIGAYVGHGDVAGNVINCYVTGKIECTSAYAGGIMGTNDAVTTITDSYAQVDVKGKAYAGGLVGRGRKTINLNNCYVSGTVAGEGAVNLLATTDKTSGVTLTVNKVVVVNTGAEEMTNYGTMVSGSVSTNIADVATWDAFNAGKTFNELPALNWQENAEAGTVGEGTEANPYEIATAADLANMWKLMKEDAVTYFVQTADINMSQISEYTAPNGYNGKYNRAINYDGKNHIISNFAPATRDATADNGGYYCTTIFGVMQGTVKNLGVVDAACINPSLEGGILGGFGGGNWVAGVPSKIDNVFVTGEVVGSTCGYGVQNGGLFGVAAAAIEITNSYAQVDVDAVNVKEGLADGAKAGGFYAVAGDNNVTLANCYFAGEVKGATANLIANGTVKATDVYAFGTGTAVAGATVVPAGDATAIAAIKGWAAFNEGKLFNELPALNWQDVAGSGIDEIASDNADAPVEYYNLQGIRVENPANGLYIRKQGSKATKVLVR
ncbi:MAG: hypothetical protein K2I64_03730 [Muribaculaceae bacterium]|nr:hypothetical protein [Muribaculaceae bacterium]